MSIFVEVVDERLDVSYSEAPFCVYRTSVATLICDAASEPYRRGQSPRWFATPHRPALCEMNGRPC